jgi:peptidoglycan hydrolase-like protein with peptidoglycan-binding domain
LLQTKLIQQGYDLEPYGADGSFGAKTQSAVKAFQKNHNLNADGIVGPKTWETLNNTEPVEWYTVTVPHLTPEQANVLLGQYPDAVRVKEK